MVLEKRAKELFESGKIENLEIGTFQGLSDIHQFLFQDIYDFAGKIRELKYLIQKALTDDLGKEQFFKGIDASYYYEGYYEIKTEDL